MQEDEIIIYETDMGRGEVNVRFKHETVWLSLSQMAKLFQRDKSVISRHITKLFTENELEKDTVIAKFATTASDNKIYQVEYYNLDVIMYVGYRINSAKGVAFRKWATDILKQYLKEGYVLNKNRLLEGKLEELQNTVELRSNTLIKHNLIDEEGKQIINIVNNYSKTWKILEAYDDNSLEFPSKLHQSNNNEELMGYEYINNIISRFKNELNINNNLFGRESNNNKMKAILGNLLQTFDGHELYPSIEEKAAYLLYLIIKDHPFIDGNKRIGCLLFLTYLQHVGVSTSHLNNSSLTAIALLIAESEPSQMEIMIKLIINLIQ
jgi:DNA ligase (NAD+)